MLTRSRKKLNAGKDKSCPKNSNQKYSTVPSNDVVEVGDMVTMDHGGTSGGLDDDCQQTDNYQVAWLLREMLNDLVDVDKGEFPGVGLRSLLDMAASRNIVSVDSKMLNPVLWRTLPKELLHLVLARLPLPYINRLCCLSREWRKNMATANSDINQACREASPTMIALVSHSYSGPPFEFFIKIHDFTTCRWQYTYHLHLQRPWNDDLDLDPAWTPMDACDGGLVCFILLRKPTKINPLCIVVVNLVTRVQHELPPLHYQYFALPAMVQIKVDFDTKCYKVVVAGYIRSGRLTIEIYDSGTRHWTRATPPCGSIFGPVHNLSVKSWHLRLSRTTPGAYNFAEGKLELYNRINPCRGESVMDSVLKRDRMFVLLEQKQMDASHGGMEHQVFCITEYHVDNKTKGWMQWRSYECPFLKELRWQEAPDIRLNACDGFLMIIVRLWGRSPYFWVLDLSTSKWSNLPEASTGMFLTGSMMCRCQALWNINP